MNPEPNIPARPVSASSPRSAGRCCLPISSTGIVNTCTAMPCFYMVLGLSGGLHGYLVSTLPTEMSLKYLKSHFKLCDM